MHEKYFEKTHDIQLRQLGLVFDGAPYSNVFTEKNNKTVGDTLKHRRYERLKEASERAYPNELTRPLGEFLGDLKRRGDGFYKQFLNKYGDGTYMTFRLKSAAHHDLIGVYTFFVNDQLRYIGRTATTMKNRINNGYGKIAPKNCYLDGQATNCHLNALIAKNRDAVSLWLHPMQNENSIKELEEDLIRRYKPAWNIQKP